MTSAFQAPGQFIVVEGMDGCGKTTIHTHLAEMLRKRGLTDLVTTREVGGTPMAEELRAMAFKTRPSEPLDPVARLLLISAARIQHLTRVVFPSTEAGHTVLCDRFVPSTRVYQGLLDGHLATIDELHSVKGLTGLDEPPDMFIYLNVEAEVAYARGKARDNVDNDTYKTGLEQAKKICQAYRQVMNEHIQRQDCIVHVVNTTPDLPFVLPKLEAIADDIMRRREMRREEWKLAHPESKAA